ncbi:MAG TPA: hypothetical protein VKU82_15700 [Planctomycetaceae bacterium]|nr:hypothetical protein [Planctomycetaceae bacterium]
MAKRADVNKSQMIRDAVKAHPDKAPAEIAAILRQDGVAVTGQYVSTIKSNDKKARRAKRGGGARRAKTMRAAPGNGLGPVGAALDFIRSAGSLEAAKQALTTLEEIGKVVR